MRENRDSVVPVNILTPFARAPFSWAARHTTVCLDILVSVDYLTKWSKAWALPNQQAKTVAEKLLEMFLHFSLPDKYQGRQLEGKLNEELCKLLQIEKHVPLHTTHWEMGWWKGPIGRFQICWQLW